MFQLFSCADLEERFHRVLEPLFELPSRKGHRRRSFCIRGAIGFVQGDDEIRNVPPDRLNQ